MTPLDVSSLGLDELIDREWLATNGVGGYACSTLSGLNTRKYHGLLVAAMAPPVRRMVLLSRVEEFIHVNGWPFPLASSEYPGTIHPEGYQYIRAFSRLPFPRWAYQGDGWTVEKSLRLLRGQNTVVLTYTLLAGGQNVDLELRPLMALRPIHEMMYQWNGRLIAELRGPGEHRIPPTTRTPEVFFAHDGAFEPDAHWYINTIYRRENERGYGGLEDLWDPGIVRWTLSPGQSVHFVCSTDPIKLQDALAEADRQYAPREAAFGRIRSADATLDSLVTAANQFVLSIPQDGGAERATAIMSAYPWPAPSVRQSLIALPGLLLVTGRHAEARDYLLSLAGKLRDGLVPTLIPEDGSAPTFSGADTSLWFINAVHQYLCYSHDTTPTRQRLLEVVVEIIRAYQRGTELGLRVDEKGLLELHAPGVAATWMDAQIDGWIITPRTGRPVELNALWHNALRIAAEMSDKAGNGVWSAEFAVLAARAKHAFNQVFWNASAGCCYDVVTDHGPDPSVRPNQLLAASLTFPALDAERAAQVLEKVMSELLTPLGVRTLSPRDPAYQGHYAGDVIARDRAYHNGSAYPWLLGPLVSTYVRVHGRGDESRRQAERLIAGCMTYLTGEGLGCLRELFDGEAPHRPGGAITSAPAVAELLRCYAEDILNAAPGALSADPPKPLPASTEPAIKR